MSPQTAVQEGMPSVPASQGEAYRWIKCEGCDGRIGIPADWNENTVICPKCESVVPVNGRVLYLPPNMAARHQDTAANPGTGTPSLDLIRKDNRVLIC